VYVLSNPRIVNSLECMYVEVKQYNSTHSYIIAHPPMGFPEGIGFNLEIPSGDYREISNFYMIVLIYLKTLH